MFQFRHSPLMRTLVTPLTLMAFVSACSSWSTLKEPVAASIAEAHPAKVRVTTANEGQLILTSPAVESDTLTGVIPGTKPVLQSASYPVEQVVAVETWYPSPRGEPTWVSTDSSLDQLCAEQTAQIRLTLSDGTQVALGSPRIEGDRVVGISPERSYVPRTAIGLTEVTKVEKYTGDKTGLIVAVTLGAAALIALAVVATNNAFEDLGEGLGQAFSGGY
jgi:hypothetical protein